MTDTAALRAAAQAATPGPWRIGEQVQPPDSPEMGPDVGSAIVGPNGQMVVSAYNTHCCQFPIDIDVEPADAAYIALASPDRILELCEELERKTAALEDLVLAASVRNNPALPRLIEQARAALEGKPTE